ncbi:hypothetical protein B484DRAFT_451040 [Ochromonadaceae sp. CCMP2298]|nr:hypothetical protein B484DRAFT_451040 [Ochromonadaceae sp. CCMP2298]
MWAFTLVWAVLLWSSVGLAFQRSLTPSPHSVRQLGMSYQEGVAGEAPLYVTRGQVLGPWYVTKVVLNPPVGSGSSGTARTAGAAGGAGREEDSVALASRLRSLMLSLKGAFMSEDGSSVDYAAMRGSAQFAEYLGLVPDLRSIDLAALSAGQRKAFFINVYNCLAIHALVSGLLEGAGTDTKGRLRLYARAAYAIAGAVYSLNDIENGILRGNRPSAAPLTSKPFGEGDPRSAWALVCDARVHFALNCGAVSCPPIGVYSMEREEEGGEGGGQLEQQLGVATRNFLQSVRVDKGQGGQGVVRLSKLFDWYKQDFVDEGEAAAPMGLAQAQGGAQGWGEGGAQADRRLLGWVLAHVSEQQRAQLRPLFRQSPPPSISFEEYDWAVNS